MSIASDLLNLLRRPLPRPGEAPPAARGKRQAVEQAGDDVPLSEGDLLAAIEAATAERTRAEGVITEASTRREALLMQPDTDGAILDAGRDIDAAQLALERLDRIEPDLWTRLRTLRHEAACARWLVVRDRYIQRVAGFAAALDSLIRFTVRSWKRPVPSCWPSFPPQPEHTVQATIQDTHPAL